MKCSFVLIECSSSFFNPFAEINLFAENEDIMADSKRRVSNRSIKRKSLVTQQAEEVKKKVRRCEKAGCLDIEPCCCLLTEGCTESGYTSRWYHLSLGEHFCNNCFDNLYRPGRKDNLIYNNWINEWIQVARVIRPTIKVYVTNELLPYWVKCTAKKCGKWRRISKSGVLDSEFIKNFKCPMASSDLCCEIPENNLVALTSNPYFMKQHIEAPLLKHSPAAVYLKRFLSEDVGMCPLNAVAPQMKELEDIEPFSIGQCGEASIWPKPDEMDDDEEFLVSGTLISSATYLGLRNLIVTLWNLSSKEWLNVEAVHPYLICRGLVRIHLLSLVDQIIMLLTRKSVINYGAISNPLMEKVEDSGSDVLIIGAGISGLAAGKHLHNLGLNVTIFESSSSLGGRAESDPLISKANIIQGLLNNPFKILSLQTGEEYQKLKGNAVVFDSNGKPISSDLEKRMQIMLRGIAQGALERSLEFKIDSNWYDKIMNTMTVMNSVSSSKIDLVLFEHLLGLLELELGADLRNLSLLSWESAMSVKGDNAFFPGGLKALLVKLAENLNIIYNNKVSSIDYSDKRIKVISENGKYFFDKVLITTPLPVLRNGGINFTPLLPDIKTRAIESLGDYCCAKLIMQFSKKFWVSRNQDPFQEFSVVNDKQLFKLFLDVTVDEIDAPPTLIAIIPPQSCELLKNKKNEDILEECMKQLRDFFVGKKSIPEPSKWYLSKDDGNSFVSYGSFLKVGSEPSAFDDMAETVDGKLYFAGEATFRNIPGNKTGAYLSGLREAAKILKSVELV